MRTLNKDQLHELEMLRVQVGGELKPDDVVEFARSNNTALHSAFEWDDTEAAVKYRMQQAGQVIRVAVTMLPRPDGALIPVRAYVYDQTRAVYALTQAVVQDDVRAEVLLKQMRAEIHRVTARYRRYAELVPHIDAALAQMEAVEEAEALA
jgi:hypothetical protein